MTLKDPSFLRTKKTPTQLRYWAAGSTTPESKALVRNSANFCGDRLRIGPTAAPASAVSAGSRMAAPLASGGFPVAVGQASDRIDGLRADRCQG